MKKYLIILLSWFLNYDTTDEDLPSSELKNIKL